MRNISFALTTDQIRAGTKTVTRRIGWVNLKPGTLLQPVRKGMGLKPGEKIERLRGPIRVTGVRFEPLRRMMDDPRYGIEECIREGFAESPIYDFVQMFCSSHKGCTPDSIVTRIEFEYVDDSRVEQRSAREAHNLEVGGSNPSPATSPSQPGEKHV